MLRAIHANQPDVAISVPSSLDDIDGLLALRAAVEERLAQGELEIILDCSSLQAVSHPALGWLLETARHLATRGGEIVLREVTAAICLQLRTLGPELPGVQLLRATVHRD